MIDFPLKKLVSEIFNPLSFGELYFYGDVVNEKHFEKDSYKYEHTSILSVNKSYARNEKGELFYLRDPINSITAPGMGNNIKITSVNSIGKIQEKTNLFGSMNRLPIPIDRYKKYNAAKNVPLGILVCIVIGIIICYNTGLSFFTSMFIIVPLAAIGGFAGYKYSQWIPEFRVFKFVEQ